MKAPLADVGGRLSVRDFLRSAFAAFSFAQYGQVAGAKEQNQVTQLDMGAGHIQLTFDPGEFDFPSSRLVDWVNNAGRAVQTYYGAFPVPRLRVRVQSSNDRTGVFHGTTWGSPEPHTRIFVGRRSTQEQLHDDWMMTHEIVHTAFPSVSDDHHWIEEGIATYVEPVARVQAGQLSAQKIWADMVAGMWQGQPRSGDSGLDNTHTWGRTYWGGALFCLQADVQIRVATQNRAGLQQALQGIQRAGGTIDRDWDITDAFTIGDKSTNTGLLTALYSEMKDKPVTVDLASLWQKLGVQPTGAGAVSLDDHAPWASIRTAITASPVSKPADSPTARINLSAP